MKLERKEQNITFGFGCYYSRVCWLKRIESFVRNALGGQGFACQKTSHSLSTTQKSRGEIARGGTLICSSRLEGFTISYNYQMVLFVNHILPIGGIRVFEDSWSGICSPAWQYRGEWPSGLYSLRQVTEVKLGRVRSNSGWVTSEA